MDRAVVNIPERHDNLSPLDYNPGAELDQVGGAYDAAVNPNSSWENKDPFEASKPLLKAQYIDNLRPGSDNHRQAKSQFDKYQKDIDDAGDLFSGPGANLFDPVHAVRFGLDGATESDRKRQLKKVSDALKRRQATIRAVLDEMKSKVEAHDSGVEWVPPAGFDKTGPETVGNLDLHTRYQKGDVPVEEFGKNDRLTVAKTADTHGGKITNFFGAPDHIAGNPNNVSKQRDELVDLAIKGQRSKHWYDYTSKIVNLVTRGNKEEARKLGGALAITSANNSLDGNLLCALRAYDTYRTALRLGTYIPIKAGHGAVSDAKLEGLLYGGHQTVGGRKVNNFFHNILKGIDPSLSQGATNDLWMKRVFGYDIGEDGSTGNGPANIRDDQYSYMQNMLHQVGKKLEERTGTAWSADQVQAALWTAGRESHLADDRIARRESEISKLDHHGRLLGTHKDYENDKAALRKIVNEAHESGEISRDDLDSYRELFDGGNYTGNDPLRIKDSLASIGTKLNQNVNHLVALKQSDDARLEDILKAESAERERGRLARNVVDPQAYDFVDSAHKMVPAAMNVSLIPSSNTYSMDSFNEEAPHSVKSQYTQEAAPIIQEVLSRLGIPRAIHGDTLGYGDHEGRHHPLFGIGLNAPTETIDGTKVVHANSDNMNRLANAMIGYIFRQPKSSYATMTTDREGEPNTAFFRIKTGQVGMPEWKSIIGMKDAVCQQFGIDRHDIEVVPSTSNGGHGVSFINHSGLDHEKFQRATRQIMSSADIANRGLSFDHLVLSNKGERINESWRESDESGNRREPGANYRDAIRKYGGDSALAYADHVHESKVKPLIEKYSGWRELVGRDPVEGLDEPIRRVFASEVDGRGRPGHSPRTERIRDRCRRASKIELSELTQYAKAVAEGRSLLDFGMRGVVLNRICVKLVHGSPNT